MSSLEPLMAQTMCLVYLAIKISFFGATAKSLLKRAGFFRGRDRTFGVV